MALAAAAILGRGSTAAIARRTAARHLEAGAIDAAERSLDWADWLAPGDEANDLMRAACFRRLGDIDAWRSALEMAERSGVPAAAIEREHRVGNIRWGQVESVAWGDYDALIDSGAAPRDAVHAVVHGLLAKGDRQKAQNLIDAWAKTNPGGEDEASFLRGVAWWSAGKLDSAQAEFEKTLDRQPGHELAHAGLARLFEDQHRYQQALEHDHWLVTSAPDRESARVDLARIYRKLGRMKDVRAVLKPPAPGTDVSERMALELAEMEFESGNYQTAQRWFDRAHLERQRVPESIRAAATSAALLGDLARAEQLFPSVDDPQGISRRRDELMRRIALDPADFVAAGELRQLPVRPAVPGPDSDSTSAPAPLALFRQHCAACHGDNGNGAGRAARHLHPRPRNLRADRFRLISTLNHVPTREDIERVIREGIPGASMPSFARLPKDQQRLLAEEVLRLYGERFREE
ncbi:MAG: c-type cytochrome, partial [Planctomycetaceae bacterium]|nr:c-type cytochrome [Planctomycetaceae bacterium]